MTTNIAVGDILELRDRWDDGAYYTVVVDSPDDAVTLKIEAEAKGLIVEVRTPDTISTALKFARQL